MIFGGSDTDEYEGTRLPKTNTRVRAVREKNADVSELYPVSYTHLRAHETRGNLVCRLLLEKKKK